MTEKETRKYVKRNNIDVMAKVCPMDGNSSRESMKNLINSLSNDLPYIRSNMIGAIKRQRINGWKEM